MFLVRACCDLGRSCEIVLKTPAAVEPGCQKAAGVRRVPVHDAVCGIAPPPPQAVLSQTWPNNTAGGYDDDDALTVTDRDHLLVPHAKFSWPCSPVCRCIIPRLFIYIHIEIRFCLVRLLCQCAATFVYSSPHSHHFALPPSCPREHRHLIPTFCMNRCHLYRLALSPQLQLAPTCFR